MSVVVRIKYGEITVDGAAVAAESTVVNVPAEIAGDQKQVELENQTNDAVHMTVGDPAEGGSQMNIPAGATVTVTGPLPIKLEAAHA